MGPDPASSPVLLPCGRGAPSSRATHSIDPFGGIINVAGEAYEWRGRFQRRRTYKIPPTKPMMSVKAISAITEKETAPAEAIP